MGRGEKIGGGGYFIILTDSSCCVAETNTAL